MKYIYLMKKIIEAVNIDNEDIIDIKEKLLNNENNIDEEDYKKEIEKYINGKAKDLYC